MSRIRPHLEALVAPGARFAIVTENVHGVDVRTFADRFRHLAEFVPIGEAHGDREFLVQGTTRLTYAEAFDRARRLAAGVRDRFEVRPGDRVGVLGSNHVDWVVAYWAGVILDAVVVPFNAWWTAEELAFGFDDSGTSVLAVDERRSWLAIEAGFDAGRMVVWGGPGSPGSTAMDDLAACEPADLPGEDRRSEDDTAVLFYTSGTTGRPKASANTHRNVVSAVLNAAAMVRAAKAASTADGRKGSSGESQAADLTVIPLFHTTGTMAVMIPFVWAGHRLVFMPPGRFDPVVAAEVIERERVTRFGGVPTIVSRIVESPGARAYDLSSVRSISYGGAPASPHLLERIAEVFPSLKDRVIQGYGLTETSALTTLNIGVDYREHPDSVGIAVPTAEIRIVDVDGRDLPTRRVGEIWVRGAHVIPGYWERPEENAESFTDGWLHTGDIGFLDDEGFLHITDRAKDVIIRGGENVYCVEVETTLISHPAVVEAAVVGAPHQDLGEEVHAFVVVDGTVTADELATHCARHLASFKVPSIWDVGTEPLPRNPSGKVLKGVLRGSTGSTFAVGDGSPL